MSIDGSNDTKNADAEHGPDAHGHAAMLLVESLIHGLIARDVITVADAVEIVDIAIDVQVDDGHDRDAIPPNLQRSLGLLDAIGNSLSRDVLLD